MAGQEQAQQARARRLKRIAWRAAHRGTREMDFLLGRFAEARLAAWPDRKLDLFESLLAEPDPVIQSWIFAPPAERPAQYAALVEEIRQFHGLNPKASLT